MPGITVTPAIVDQGGGVELTLTGTFVVGTPYQVHLGPLGTAADPRCYGGSGNGYYSLSSDGVTLHAATPPVTNGESGLRFVSIAGFSAAAIVVVEAPYRGVVLDSRRCHPPWVGAGARRLELEAQRYLLGPGIPKIRSLSDAIVISDAVSRFVEFLRQTTDAVLIADHVFTSLNDILYAALTETLAVGDAVTTTLALGRGATDALVVVDGVARVTDAARLVADVIAAGDHVFASLNDVISAALTETLVLGDTVAATLILERMATDSLVVVEGASRVVHANRIVTDAVAIAEVVAATTAFERVVADAAVVADSVTAEII